MKNNGFTLVEMMVAACIVGVLASVALPTYQNYRIKAATAEVIASLIPLKTALTACSQSGECMYKLNHGVYKTQPDFGHFEGSGAAINVVGEDWYNFNGAVAQSVDYTPVKLPIPAGNINNPNSILQGNETKVIPASMFLRGPTGNTSVLIAGAWDFVFNLKLDTLTGTSSATNLVLRAAFQRTSTATLREPVTPIFTLGGDCKKYQGGAIC